MLNSFWNLCRVCPSMPIDKLNSEYRTNFKWHEGYHAQPIHEAICSGPTDAPICSEPAIPRRKKHPELAYRTHEVLRMVNGGDSSDSLETESVASKDVDNRARSEERNQNRNRTGPRSKSVDPYLGRRRPWSASVNVTGAGLLSSKGPPAVEHRIHAANRRWDNSSNPVYHIDKNVVMSHVPRPYSAMGSTTAQLYKDYVNPEHTLPLMTQSYPSAVHVPLPVAAPAPVESETASGIPKTTEYRSQFAWPPGSEGAAAQEGGAPRKSISMGAIQAAGHAYSKHQEGGQKPTPVEKRDASVHREKVVKSSPPVEEPIVVAKKVVDREVGLATVNLPNADNNVDDEAGQKQASGRPKRSGKTEYKAQFRAPSKYMYVEGSWKKMSRSADSAELKKEVSEGVPWYGEVIELRKKAGEYKCRSINSNLAPEKLSEPYTRQQMIEELSTRTNLSALALATTPRNKAKEEKKEVKKPPPIRPSTYKEKDKTANGTKAKGEIPTAKKGEIPTAKKGEIPTAKKGEIPTGRKGEMPPAKKASTAMTTTPHLPDSKGQLPKAGHNSSKQPKGIGGEEVTGVRPQPTVRHHLERTTPTPGETGYMITSPTRDHKLEPVQIQKTPTAKESKGPPTRSSSAHRSPKRAPRPMSMIVPGSKAQVNGVINGAAETPRKAEVKRPRPTSLATSVTPARPKTTPAARTVGKTAHAEEALPRTHGEGKTRSASGGHPSSAYAAPGAIKSTYAGRSVPKSAPPVAAPIKHPVQKGPMMVNGEDEQPFTDDSLEDSDTGKSSQLARSESKEIEETIMMKSPPEPTRVKSPEQILVRSPEPVKWTIPLETGIKWTGTPKSEDEPIKTIKEETRGPPTMVSPVEAPLSRSPSQPLDFDQTLTPRENGDAVIQEQSDDVTCPGDQF